MDIGFPTSELLSALRGYPGSIFAHDEAFKVNEANPFCRHLSHSQLDVARQILPLGSDFKRIQDYVDKHFTDIRAYPAALAQAIEDATLSYRQALTVIENDLKKSKDIPLSLLLPILKFKDTLALSRQLLDSFEDGSITINQFLTTCSDHSQSPFSEVSKCFKMILNGLVKVLWDDVWSWMVFGHLRKGCDGDFFISENQSQAILLVDDLPSFVSMRSAEKIFFAGQLVRYYNSTLSHDNIAGFFEKSIDEKFKNITEISALPFKVRSYNLMIESIRREAALFSWNHVMTNEELVRSFNVIRDIYFTRNENLWIFLIENLRKKSLKNVPAEKKHNFIRTWIETILCKFYVNQDSIDDFVSRLQFSFDVTHKVLPQISIRMTLPPLTQRIFQSSTFEKYDKMLNFLLELTLVKRELSESWKRSIANKRMNPPHWFTRHKLLVLFDYIYYYYKVNIIESSCEIFVEHLESCQDYEQMELRHKSFLVNLIKNSFLELDAVEKLISQLMNFVHDHFGKEMKIIEENDVKNLGNLFSDLYCLLSTLKSFNLSPSLSHLVFQLRGCLNKKN